MLAGITIHNFALLRNFKLGLGIQELLDFKAAGQTSDLPSLNPLNVFIGQNASGKSSFFEALQFLRLTLRGDVQEAANLSKQSSYSDLVYRRRPDLYDLTFDLVWLKRKDYWLNYRVKISSDQNHRPFIAEETCRAYDLSGPVVNPVCLLQSRLGQGRVTLGTEFSDFQLTEKKISAVHFYGRQKSCPDLVWLYNQMTRFYCADFKHLPSKIKGKARTGGHKHLSHKLDNIANVLYYLKKEKGQVFRRLQEGLDDNLPKHSRIDLDHLDRVDNQGQIKLLLAYLILADPRPLLAFDQPDAGLHYDLVDSLALGFRDYAIQNPQSQLFISTHNVNLLEGFSPREVWAFDRLADREGNDRVEARYLADDPLVMAMYEEGVGLGSLWYSGYLDRATQT